MSCFFPFFFASVSAFVNSIIHEYCIASPKHEPKSLQSYCFITSRQVMKQHIYGLITSRQVMKQHIYCFITSRQVMKQHIYCFITSRQVMKQHIYSFITSRQVMKPHFYSFITSRQVMKTLLSLASPTIKIVAIKQKYGTP